MKGCSSSMSRVMPRLRYSGGNPPGPTLAWAGVTGNRVARLAAKVSVAVSEVKAANILRGCCCFILSSMCFSS